MVTIFDLLYNQLEIFLIVMLRITGMFIISPIFGKRNVPVIAKVGFIFFISIIAVNIVKIPNISHNIDMISLFIILLQEFMVGIIIGLISYLIFSSCFLAGQMIDMQIGFGMISVLDPQSNIQVPITGNLYYIITIIIFFLVNGHHALILAVIDSYNMVPVGKFMINSFVLKEMTSIFTEMFVIAIKLSVPIIGTMFIVDLTLGIISRTMPQLNVFVVGAPLKIILGLLIIMLTMTIFTNLISNMFDSMYIDISNILKGMVP